MVYGEKSAEDEDGDVARRMEGNQASTTSNHTLWVVELLSGHTPGPRKPSPETNQGAASLDEKTAVSFAANTRIGHCHLWHMPSHLNGTLTANEQQALGARQHHRSTAAAKQPTPDSAAAR